MHVKKNGDWWWPDGEVHMISWMAEPKNHLLLNGRTTYQGAKQVAALAHCVRRRTAVDVGSHVGLWAFNLAPAFARVVAFEPVAAHRACFERNVMVANVQLEACALGEHEGSVSIWSNPTSSGDSWINGPGNIPMRTLDSFGLDDVDFIKVDAEGFEESILRGAQETIRATRPVICVEQKRDMATKFGLKPKGAITWLTLLGYRQAQEISGDHIMVPA